MLDIQLLRNDLDRVAARLATRGVGVPLEQFQQLEAARKGVQTRTQELQNRRNALSKQIGEAKRKGADATALMAEAAALPDDVKRLEDELEQVQSALADLLLVIGNCIVTEKPSTVDYEAGMRRSVQLESGSLIRRD